MWGSVQLLNSGEILVFLADHPTTGGYPVIAVVDRVAASDCAQARPGALVTLTRARAGARDGGGPGGRRRRRRMVSFPGGTVIVAEPPRRLVLTFDSPDEPHDPPTRVTFEIEPYEDIVRLTVIHEDIPDEANLQAVSVGWPAVMANLKSLLETGHALPQPPWEMHADLRRSQMSQRDS